MSTGSAFITVNKNGDNSIVVVAGANAALSEKDIEENIRLIEECDILVLQMEIPITTVLYAAKRAKELGKKLYWTLRLFQCCFQKNCILI